MAFRDDPAYLKAIRRRRNIDPSVSAILDTRDIGAAFAGEEERRNIVGTARAARQDIRERGFAEDIRSRKVSEELGQERLDFAREDFGFQRGQAGIANIISGVGAGVDILGGVGALREAGKAEAHIDILIQRARERNDHELADNLTLAKIQMRGIGGGFAFGR